MKSKKLLRTLAALAPPWFLWAVFLSPPTRAAAGNRLMKPTIPTYRWSSRRKRRPHPDGNATLVDDYGGNKQLITVTTKNGNYFTSWWTGMTRGKTPSIFSTR